MKVEHIFSAAGMHKEAMRDLLLRAAKKFDKDAGISLSEGYSDKSQTDLDSMPQLGLRRAHISSIGL